MKRIALVVLLLCGIAGAQSGIAVTGVTTFPAVVTKVAPTLYSGTTSVAATTLYTTPAAGVYRIAPYVQVTVAGSAGTFQPQVTFTADGHAQTVNLSNALSTTAQWTSIPSVSANSGQYYVFYADAGTTIQYAVAASGVTGTPTIRYAFTLERLQ